MSTLPARADSKAMREPSGDQSGKVSAPGESVKRLSSLPSARITYISLLPSRVEAKAIDPPSGDQAGKPSAPASFVIRVWPVPSAFITYTPALPSRSDVNANLLPFGDQSGWLFVQPALPERFTSPEPKRLTRWISTLLLRTDTNAISSAAIGDEVGRGVLSIASSSSAPHAAAKTVTRPAVNVLRNRRERRPVPALDEDSLAGINGGSQISFSR